MKISYSNSNAGEIAHPVKFLFCKHEDLRWVPETHRKAEHGRLHLQSQNWRERDRWMPTGGWPAILVQPPSFRPVKYMVSNERQPVPEEWVPRVSSGLHTFAHVCPHPAYQPPIKVNMRTLCVTSFNLLSDTTQNTPSAAPFNLYNITKKWVKTIFPFPDW